MGSCVKREGNIYLNVMILFLGVPTCSTFFAGFLEMLVHLCMDAPLMGLILFHLLFTSTLHMVMSIFVLDLFYLEVGVSWVGLFAFVTKLCGSPYGCLNQWSNHLWYGSMAE